jgi:hypothetical protein
MGIMIYNNLDYMGISLEVAIKQFRLRRAHFGSVIEAADEFFKYLLDELAPDESLQRQHVKSILYQDFLDIRIQFEHRLSRLPSVSATSLLRQTIQKRISEVESVNVSQCFFGTPESAIIEFYSQIFDALIEEVFEDLPIGEDHEMLLKRMGGILLHRDIISDSFTGLIFAGFGQNEIFPSLVAYKMDGVILGKLKRLETDRQVTGRHKEAGEILPFAQREMVDRFLYGIDPEFERAIEQYIEATFREASEVVVEGLPGRWSKTSTEELEKLIISGTAAAVTTWRKRMIPAQKGRFMNEVRSMIFLMPKQELATLAQELINLTSVKRKFSSGAESVGGPIDVALITRIDGFVWVRRKHYFEPNLNPRYFHGKFGANLT